MTQLNLATLLKLERPLGMFDLESTGTNPLTDRIVQIAITSHHPDKEPIAWKTLVNPGIPIPPGATATHGITNEMVAEAPRFREVALLLAPRMVNVDLGGHNVGFDIDLFRAECARADVPWKWEGHKICTLTLWRRMRPMTLSAAYEEFGDGSKLDGAHQADVDVHASEVVLSGQLSRWAEVPRTVRELSEFMFPKNPNGIDPDGKIAWVNGVACITFGKHSGKELKDVPRDYYTWAIREGNFSDDVKQIFRGALAGVYPVK